MKQLDPCLAFTHYDEELLTGGACASAPLRPAIPLGGEKTMRRRNPHPDYVRASLKRWRTRLTRALNEVMRLEKALARAEKKREEERRAEETQARRARRERAQLRENV